MRHLAHRVHQRTAARRVPLHDGTHHRRGRIVNERRTEQVIHVLRLGGRRDQRGQKCGQRADLGTIKEARLTDRDRRHAERAETVDDGDGVRIVAHEHGVVAQTQTARRLRRKRDLVSLWVGGVTIRSGMGGAGTRSCTGIRTRVG